MCFLLKPKISDSIRRVKAVVRTLFHDIVSRIRLVRHNSLFQWIIRDWEKTFRQNDELLPGNVVLLDCFRNQLFRNSLAHVNLWPGVHGTLEYALAVSQVVIPLSHAALRRGRALSSFNTHFCQVSEPYDMHPKTVPLIADHCGGREEGQLLTRETLRPELPRRTYFIWAEDISG